MSITSAFGRPARTGGALGFTTLRCPAFDLIVYAHTHSLFYSSWLEQFSLGRYRRAEHVINRLRERERDLMVRLAERGAEVAALRTTLDFLKARTAPDT